MELSFFPNDYDFDESPPKVSKSRASPETEIVKVRPRNQIET